MALFHKPAGACRRALFVCEFNTIRTSVEMRAAFLFPVRRAYCN
jgi:hypothetical protein